MPDSSLGSDVGVCVGVLVGVDTTGVVRFTAGRIITSSVVVATVGVEDGGRGVVGS